MRPVELQLLLLILAANGAPVLGAAVFGKRGNRPVDGGRVGWDGRPLFGQSKTWRGIALALVAGAVMAGLLGLSPGLGLAVGGGVVLGDLLSSFSKRRLGLPPSSMAFGLDQIPEALLPLWIVKQHVGLNWFGIAETVAAFVILELALSRLLYHLRIRDRPY